MHTATATPAWQQLNTTVDGPGERYEHNCAGMGGALYLFGGNDGDYQSSSDLWKYAVAANQWSIVDVHGGTPPVSLGRTMVHVKGFLWLYGEAGLWVFSPEEGTWRDVGGQVRGASPPSRTHQGCAVVGDSLYVFGGDGGGVDLSDLWVIDAAEGRLHPEAELVWTELSAGTLLPLSSAPFARRDVGMAALGGRMYIFGGFGTNGRRLS